MGEDRGPQQVENFILGIVEEEEEGGEGRKGSLIITPLLCTVVLCVIQLRSVA